MIQKITHTCQGTCSRQIDIDIEDGIIRKVAFTGGCHGNTQGVAALVRGMKVEEATRRNRLQPQGNILPRPARPGPQIRPVTQRNAPLNNPHPPAAQQKKDL